MFTQSEKQYLIEMQHEIAKKANIKEFNIIKYPINDSFYDVASTGIGVILSSPAILDLLGKMLRGVGVRIGKKNTNILVQVGNILEKSGDWTSSVIFKAVKLITKPLFLNSDDHAHDIFVHMIFIVLLIKSVVSIRGVETLNAMTTHNNVAIAIYKDTLQALDLKDIRKLLSNFRKNIPKFIDKIIQYATRFKGRYGRNSLVVS